ncbi:hypothetical protein [Natrialba sp. INN-245]|uniref:hypothetical protein n=1 Tax=Natrialba sp. INN-245 TaxID=2690967 RepID=UPI001310B182|nr:hypothetical protein [Natrialba sp. INN-245]MWV40339.1 hypothetical protein [Natrialba sp. INN-245]
MSTGPIFAFDALSADRGVDLSAAETSDAYLSVEGIQTVVDDQNEPEEVVRISNNFDDDLDLDLEVTIQGEGLEEASPFDGSVSAGESTTYAVTCEPGTGGGQTDVAVTIHSATGDRITVEGVSETITVERDCPGPGGPGEGFDWIYASDVSGSVSASEERQEFRFTLSETRDPWEQIEIDLSDPRGDGVNYDGTFRNGDVQIESGSGNVWTDDNEDTITYEIAPQDDHDDEIVISVGSYSTDSLGGPYDVEFTRIETGDTGTTQFVIDGDDGDDGDGNDDVVVESGSTHNEPIETDGNVVVESDATVNNGIDAGGDVTAEDGSIVHGTLEADGIVTIGSGVPISDGIISGDDVVIGDGTEVSDNIVSGGSVTIGEGSLVNDNIDADGDVYIQDDAIVHGDVTSGGDVVIGENVTINGEITEG